ncbi:Transcriptional regulator (fragment) [Burkholderia sp. 8Y]
MHRLFVWLAAGRAHQNNGMMSSKLKSEAEEHATESLHDLRVLRIGFLLLENFSLIALGTAVDPLRIANMLVERTVYEYELIGTSGDIVRSSDGIRVVPDKSMAEASKFDAVFVVGPNPIPRKGIGGIMDWLRLQARQGIALGGLDTGS